MFNIGPMEFLVLAAVALIVFGPDRLPELAKDAARMLRTLRDLAQGARSQLNSELGPEFADFDLASLNPRTAIKNALLGDDDFSSLNPTAAIQRALRGEDDPEPARPGLDLTKPDLTQRDLTQPDLTRLDLTQPDLTKPAPQRPAGNAPLTPGERPPVDPDAT